MEVAFLFIKTFILMHFCTSFCHLNYLPLIPNCCLQSSVSWRETALQCQQQECHWVLKVLYRGSTDRDELCPSPAWVLGLCGAGQRGDEEEKLVQRLLWGKGAWQLTSSASLFQSASCNGTPSPSTRAACDVGARIHPSSPNHSPFAAPTKAIGVLHLQHAA